MYGHAALPELSALFLVTLLALPGAPEEEPDEDDRERAPEISWLRSQHDREALFQILERDQQLTQGLDAAEALAELGDVRGLDHLIATLSSPSTYLRHQAALILKRLDHPRGLRALQDHPETVAASSRSAQREELYEDLNAADTDELVALWHEHDRSQWSDLAFDVMEQILVERLGKLPRPVAGSADRLPQEVDESTNPKIQDLWRRADVEGLADILGQDPNVALQLEAAEALAALGDDEALEILIETLDDPDQESADMAAQILDWLALPAGRAALRDRGIEFETGAAGEIEVPQAQPQEQRARPAAPAAPAQPFATQEPKTAAPPISRVPSLPGAAPQPVWQEPEALPWSRLGSYLTGAVGGLLGFLVFRLGLQLLGVLPFATDLAGWLRTSTLASLGVSMLVGAMLGPLGSHVAQAVAARLGSEPGEGDPLPVIGALLAGMISALLADVLLFA